MRHAISFVLLAGLTTILACNNNTSDGNVCTESGGVCVGPNSGMMCEGLQGLPCPGQGVVCCDHATPMGQGGSGGSSGTSSGGSSGKDGG
jgi:hypothetical protein